MAKSINTIEVKSGAKGSLKSLHEFMDITPHNFAVRFLQNKISIEQVKTRNGKIFHLLNLPHFAVSQLDKYIEWGMNAVGVHNSL